MIRTALKVAGGTFLFVLLSAGLWWHVNGLHFLYSRFSPSTEQIIGDQEVPRELSAAKWQADLDSLAQILRQRLIYVEDAYGSRRLARRVDSLKRLVPEQTRAEPMREELQNLKPMGEGGRSHVRSTPFRKARCAA